MTTEKLAIHGGEPVRTRPFGNRHSFGDPEREQLMEVMDNADTKWTSRYKTQEFEDGFARRHGVNYAVATDSGTGSLHAAVAAVNPEPGDEIITAPATDIGSVLGIVLQNAIPVFSDWRPGAYLNQDAADIESRITERTRAIMVVHLFGYPVDMDAILDVARRHNLPVIEDCSQAHLAEYKGRLVGTMGDMGCFSLGGKPLTAAGGGILITNSEEFARRAKGFAYKGSEYDEGAAQLAQAYVRQPRLVDRVLVPRRLPSDEQPDGRRRHRAAWPHRRLCRSAQGGGSHHGGTYSGRCPASPRRGLPARTTGAASTFTASSMTKMRSELRLTSSPRRARPRGVPVGGPYIRGMGLYRYPIFAEDRTYGQSGYPFVDEQGNRRVDYNALHLPVLEEELPKDADRRRQQLLHRGGRHGHRLRDSQGGDALLVAPVRNAARRSRRANSIRRSRWRTKSWL